MSRLDSAIRRLQAQRACLDHAAGLVRGLPGPFLELGLGNGRTYDHLRETCPEREIFVFERNLAAHPDCVPDETHLILGDIRRTLPATIVRFPDGVPLVHADIGSADAEADAGITAFLADQLPGLLMPGGIALSDQDVRFDGAEAVALPDGVREGRYFIYRAPGGPDQARSTTTGT